MIIHHQIATIADLNILLELVQAFHETEDLPFDESVDRSVLMHFLMDASLGQA
jgi:hypothetical protein